MAGDGRAASPEAPPHGEMRKALCLQPRRRPEEGSGEDPGMQGGGEARRRVRVVYFLSRDGEVGQPHLLRVRRHRRGGGGVRLRDVKRWLSERRGEGMPESFAWSCKRWYKTGYVWEDLADDDLVTPVSDDDGEYVLEGTLITPAAGLSVATATTPTTRLFSSPSASSPSSSPAAVAAACAVGEHVSALPEDPKFPRRPETATAENPDGGGGDDDDVSPKPPPYVDDEEEEEEGEDAQWGSSGPLRPPTDASTLTATTSRQDAATGRPPPPALGCSSGEVVEEAKCRGDGEEKEEAAGRRGHAGGGGRASHVFRSLLGCGAQAVRTNDSALLPLSPRPQWEVGGGMGSNRREGGGVLHVGSHQPRDAAEEGENREGRRGGRSRRTNRPRGAPGEQRKKKTATAAAGGPAPEPNCSQCGRAFRPEKLHSHMKSCRALKDQRKNMGSGKPLQLVASQRGMLSEEASSLFLLSHKM